MDETLHDAGRPAPPANPFRAREWMHVTGLVFVTALLRLAFLAGPVGSDDSRYMAAAWKLAHGQPAGVADVAYVRGAWIIWLAGWTWLGKSIAAVMASQVAVSIGLVLTLYWLGRKLTGDSLAALLGALCWALFPVELTYAGMLLPDQLGVLLAILAAGLALSPFRAPAGQTQWLQLIAAGALCGLAVSVKEPYVFVPVILGLWALLEIRPLRVGLERSFIFGAVSVATFALEYLFFRLWTGDWMYRHHVLNVMYGPGGKIASEEHVSWRSLIHYPREVIFNPAISGLFGWLLLIAVICALRKVKEANFIALWSVIFFLFLQYGSTTLTRYQPLPMQPRYIQPMIILLFVPLGRWLADLVASPSFGRIGTALLLIAVSLQGIMVVEAESSTGLYFANLPRAVERTLATRGNELGCNVAMPLAVDTHLPPQLRNLTQCWPKIDLNRVFNPAEFEQLRDRKVAILIPNDLARLSSTRENYQALKTWLDQNARSVPIEDGETFLDRFFLASDVPILRRNAKTVAIANLYFFSGVTVVRLDSRTSISACARPCSL
jgi:hypothetical protein